MELIVGTREYEIWTIIPVASWPLRIPVRAIYIVP